MTHIAGKLIIQWEDFICLGCTHCMWRWGDICLFLSDSQLFVPICQPPILTSLCLMHMTMTPTAATTRSHPPLTAQPCSVRRLCPLCQVYLLPVQWQPRRPCGCTCPLCHIVKVVHTKEPPIFADEVSSVNAALLFFTPTQSIRILLYPSLHD